MSLDYVLRFPPVPIPGHDVILRALSILQEIGGYYEDIATRLEVGNERQTWKLGTDIRRAPDPTKVLDASTGWNGVALEVLTGFGYVKLLLWHTDKPDEVGLALFETSSVLDSQAEDSDVYEIFLLFSIALAKEFNLGCFALTREPILASLSPELLKSIVARPPTIAGRSQVIVAGVNEMLIPSWKSSDVNSGWALSQHDSFVIIKDPLFGVSDDL